MHANVVMRAFVLMAVSLLAYSPVQAFPVKECETRPDKPDATADETAAKNKLSPLLQCTAPGDDRTACNVFLGRALEILFGNTDFKTGNGSYMLANDIANGLQMPGNAGWKKIGVATDQAALDQAQSLANKGSPVVAARLGRLDDGVRRPGHVALILPGTSQQYDFDGFHWGGLSAPNSASLFLDTPDRMFIGCPLSAVWIRPNDVGLYYKP
ncbi:hypothetical protein [Mesorhizobium sp. M0800]|uniref:hypothetical protein n=1 Tax=Mesorhizobium sp. M0800 TaxID=2957000 RepID=UPI00333D63BC